MHRFPFVSFVKTSARIRDSDLEKFKLMIEFLHLVERVCSCVQHSTLVGRDPSIYRSLFDESAGNSPESSSTDSEGYARVLHSGLLTFCKLSGSTDGNDPQTSDFKSEVSVKFQCPISDRMSQTSDLGEKV